MGGKKGGGEGSKKAAGQARKAEAAAAKTAAEDAKKKAAEELKWQKGAKSDNKKYDTLTRLYLFSQMAGLPEHVPT